MCYIYYEVENVNGFIFLPNVINSRRMIKIKLVFIVVNTYTDQINFGYEECLKCKCSNYVVCICNKRILNYFFFYWFHTNILNKSTFHIFILHKNSSLGTVCF